MSGYTAEQLAALRAAYASGVLEVTYSDGRRVRYQSMDEMGRAIDRIAASLEPAASRVTHFQPGFDRGI